MTRATRLPISAGENGGRTLGHRNIVKQLTPLGNWTGSAVKFALPAERSSTARVLLVQSGAGGRIITARKLGLIDTDFSVRAIKAAP